MIPKDIRKRLEEAAEEYGKGYKTSLALEVGFMKGAEIGYKEAIAQAKEWLKDNAHDYSFSNEGCDALLADFERNINKLFREDEK